MSISETLKKVCTKLGQNNKPTYAVMAIAVVKGIARPIFTMMDKHEKPETKKYTALREGLTEVVAIPTYFACGELASKIAGKLKLPPEKQALAKNNFMFLGVCTAALFVIPALASVTIKPFMNRIQSNNDSKKNQPLHTKQNNKPSFEKKNTYAKSLQPSFSYNKTKVGGLW